MNTISNVKRPFGSLCFFTVLSVVLFLFSCNAPEGKCQLEGQFKNINQGEFYLYDLQNGTKDTITLRDGRFSYTIALTDTTVLTLLFPNYSELPIVAQPRAKVSIKGDVTNLRETTVKGTKANEQLTTFRQTVNDMTTQEATDYAEQYISNNPQSAFATYLLRRYFIVCPQPNYKKAAQLCATIQKAQPQSLAVIRLLNQLTALENLGNMDKLPDFTAIDTKGDTITNKFFNNEISVICLWSTWNYDSQNMLRLIRTIQKEHSKRLAVMSISIDAAPSEGANAMKRDSITWPNICDSAMWKSPLVALFGFKTIPDNILLDKDGHIIGRSLNNADLRNKIDSLLKL